MIQKIKAMIVKYWEVLIYLVFGVLTTVVNYVIYLPVYNILGLSAALSNAIAWVGAVAFAYLTNKPFVFKSHDWSLKTVVPELTKFVGCRVASGAADIIQNNHDHRGKELPNITVKMKNINCNQQNQSFSSPQMPTSRFRETAREI